MSVSHLRLIPAFETADRIIDEYAAWVEAGSVGAAPVSELTLRWAVHNANLLGPAFLRLIRAERERERAP